MGEKLKWALIGCGPRSHDHVKACLATGLYEVPAIADIDAAKVKEFGDAYDCTRRYSDYRQMLAQERGLDVVHLVTLASLRKAPIEAAIAAGTKAIVIEKPMALDYAEARGLVETCQRANVLLVVNHQIRLMKEWVRLRERIADGTLGQVTAMRASVYGNLISQGTHLFDLAWSVLGEPEIKWVFAGCEDRVGEVPQHPGPRNSLVLCEFGNGTRATFAVGNDSPETPNARMVWMWFNMQVKGTKGSAECQLDRGYYRWDLEGNLVERLPSGWDDECQGAAQAELSTNVARALRDPNYKHPQRGEAALVSFALVEAACRSARNGGKTIHFPLDTSENALAHWSRQKA